VTTTPQKRYMQVQSERRRGGEGKDTIGRRVEDGRACAGVSLQVTGAPWNPPKRCDDATIPDTPDTPDTVHARTAADQRPAQAPFRPALMSTPATPSTLANHCCTDLYQMSDVRRQMPT